MPEVPTLHAPVTTMLTTEELFDRAPTPVVWASQAEELGAVRLTLSVCLELAHQRDVEIVRLRKRLADLLEAYRSRP